MTKSTFFSIFCLGILTISLLFILDNNNILNKNNFDHQSTRVSSKTTDKHEMVNNGGFEQDFTSWELVEWPFPGEAQINSTDAYEGTKCASLTAQDTQKRIGYRQKINRSEMIDFSFSFSIKHDNGTLYQAGLALYYYDYEDSYLGRTYWSVSNEYQDINNSENSILIIRQQSYPKWHKVTVNLSRPGIKPPNVVNLSIVKNFEIILHVYGVSGYGNYISVWYDDISMIGSTISPHNTEIYSDNFNTGIGNFWQNPYQFNDSDDWKWTVINGKVVPILLTSCNDYTASALTQFTTISGPFNISVDLFKLSAQTVTSLQLRLLDGNYEPVAKVGVIDRWTNESYMEYAFISTSLVGEGIAWQSELVSDEFHKNVNIWRDAGNNIHIAIGGIECLSLSSTKQVTWLELYIEDSWASTFDQEVILQSNYHWFDNFYSDITEISSDTFDQNISTSWQVKNPIHTDDDWEWVNDNQRAVPKMLSTCDNYSPTALEQIITEPITGPFDFSTDIYKYAESTGTTLSLQLYDEFGYKLAEGGVYDPWASSYYKKFGQVLTPDNIVVSYKSNYLIGGIFHESVRIWRDTADIVHVSLNGQEIVTTFNPHGVKLIRLNVYLKHAASDQELINRTDSQWFDDFTSNYTIFPTTTPSTTMPSTNTSTKTNSSSSSSTSDFSNTTSTIQITSGLQLLPSLVILIVSLLYAKRKRRKDI